MPTFAERGYEFYWEQMRGVVGPANMPPEAVKWWQDTLKKVTQTQEVAGALHQAQPPDADRLDRRARQLKYLDSLQRQVRAGVKRAEGALEE